MLRPLGATTETTFSESTDARAVSSGLLQLVAALAKELSPGGSRQTSPTLDSRFNEDLGLDSLTLVELLLRAERDLGVSFRDGAIAAATPRELLQFIQFGPAAEAIGATTEELPSRPIGEVPSSAETLLEVLAWHARKHPEHTHALVFERPESPQSLTYQALYDRASAIAASSLFLFLKASYAAAAMVRVGHSRCRAAVRAGTLTTRPARRRRACARFSQYLL